MGVPMRSKARRWVGVGSLSLSKVTVPIWMVLRVRAARWSKRLRKLRTGGPSGVVWVAALASARADRRGGGVGGAPAAGRGVGEGGGGGGGGRGPGGGGGGLGVGEWARAA